MGARIAIGVVCVGFGSMLFGACGSKGHGTKAGAAGAASEPEGPQTCRRNSDCPGDLLCDRSAELCVECLSTADCADGDVCAEGACHAACRSDKDCRATDQLCSDDGACVDCIVDSHCDAGEVCSPSGTCEAEPSNEGGAPNEGTTHTGDGGSPSSSDGGAPNMPSGGTSSRGGTDAGGGGAGGSLVTAGTAAGGGTMLGPGCASAAIDPCAGIPHYTGTQTVDGDPSDFCDVPPFTLAIATSPYYRVKPPATATTKATFRVAWSETALHIFVDVADQTVYPSTLGSLSYVWSGDNIEFYASPKAPTGTFTYSRSYDYGAFEIIAAPPTRTGVATTPAGQAAFVSTGASAAVSATQYKTNLTANGYTVEAQIPWTTAAPTAGSPMGFDAGLADDVDGLVNASAATGEYRDYYVLLYNAHYVSSNCSREYEPYCDSRNWCVPTALP